jgi:26S proteasome regulatory subunit N2
MAYAGTGANSAIRRLLHIAVSDVNDDVRRSAVTSLGFILCRSPAQVPRVVQLLSESYNPHVRYGATLALGVACAGTGLLEAIEILEPLKKDPVDFVRQGACIALAMILIQQNSTLNPKADEARKLFEKIIGDKHEDPMSKFGASLAQGLIDAGGRNVTISSMSRNGNISMPAVVGLSLFTQFWYWFPMAHAVVLAFTPTGVIGVNRDLKVGVLGHMYLTFANIFRRADAQVRVYLERSSVRLCLRPGDQGAGEGQGGDGQDGRPFDDGKG